MPDCPKSAEIVPYPRPNMLAVPSRHYHTTWCLDSAVPTIPPHYHHSWWPRGQDGRQGETLRGHGGSEDKGRQSGTTWPGGRKVGKENIKWETSHFYRPEPRPTTPSAYV